MMKDESGVCSKLELIEAISESLKETTVSSISQLQLPCDSRKRLGGGGGLEDVAARRHNIFLEEHDHSVPKALGGLTNLQYLNLAIPYLAYNPNLTKLPEVIGNLRELRYLNLSRCIDYLFDDYYILNESPRTDSFIDSISALSNLEHLDLSNSDRVRNLPASFSNLRELHTLNLSNCRNLKEIPESIGTADSLKFLHADHLPEPAQLSSNVVSLPQSVVYTRNSEFSSNLVLLQQTDPVVMDLTKLENVKTTEEAQSIKLIEKQSMNILQLEWTKDVGRSVDDYMLLEKLVPPSTLTSLQIRGYNSVNFPAWLMDITHYLSNLVTMEMYGLPKCNSLPPMDQLPNLKLLYLRDMPNLEEWNTSYSSGQVCMFESVLIYDCPKLRIKPLLPGAKWLEMSKSDSVLSSWGEYTCASTTSSYPVYTTLHVKYCEVPMHHWRLLQHLPGLTLLEITDFGNLTGSLEIITHLPSLKSLNLRDRYKQKLPKWMGELTSLQELVISGCSGLKELHENMRRLTKLQSLQIFNCNRIASLPHWLGELTFLKELEMWGCDAIRSLPEGIQQLANLRELRIYRCLALKKWCELEENAKNLAHIKDKQIY